MTRPADLRSALRDLKTSHDGFVGADSDDYGIDTTVVLNKECFIPLFVKHFGLSTMAKYAREAAEFVNLTSPDQGANRFPSFLKMPDLQSARSKARSREFRRRSSKRIRIWIARETRLGTPMLKAEAKKTGDLPEIPPWETPGSSGRMSDST